MQKFIFILLIECLLFNQGEKVNPQNPVYPISNQVIEKMVEHNRAILQLSQKQNEKIIQKEDHDPPKKIISPKRERKQTTNISRSEKTKRYEVFEATAYCSCVKCCGKSDGITKSGVKVHQGTLAVDPRVIPLGTKVYIEGMGWFVAEDTGNFSGNRVDIYMKTHEEALQFGRKKIKVMI